MFEVLQYRLNLLNILPECQASHQDPICLHTYVTLVVLDGLRVKRDINPIRDKNRQQEINLAKSGIRLRLDT